MNRIPSNIKNSKFYEKIFGKRDFEIYTAANKTKYISRRNFA